MRWARHIQQDLPASIVVFLVALPLCMGVAIASGLPPAAGLVTGIIGGIVVGAIGGSPLQISGPAAGLTVLVWELVQRHGVQALGPVVLLAGVLQIVAGRIGLGRWFRAIAPPVVYGMLAGIGILIFASQFHVMVDDKPRGSGIVNLLSIPDAIVKAMTPSPDTSHHPAALLGGLTIVALVLWMKLRPERLRALPAPLVAAALAVAVAAATRAPVKYVTVPDNLLESLSFTGLRDLLAVARTELLLTAVALAVVASAETLLCAGAVDRMQDEVRTDYDRELMAQGIGNALCGAVGALPMTGVIVRSSANVESGARTRLSAILHGVWLLALVVALPAALRYVPTACLAAILVYTGYKLVSPAHIRELRQFGRGSLAIYVTTVVTIVSLDLLRGVLIGVVLSAGRLLYWLTNLRVRTVENRDQGRIDLHLEGAATFLGIPKLTATLDALPRSDEVHVHIEALTYIDHAALVAIGDWEKQERARGRRVVLEWEILDQKSEKVARVA